MTSKSRIIYVFTIILVVLLTYSPLMCAINYSSYWNPAFTFLVTDEPVIVGSIESTVPSQKTWEFDMHIHPFMSEQLMRATTAFLLVREPLPLTSIQPAFNFIWRDDNFTSGWSINQHGATNYSFNSDGDIVTITGTFTSGIFGSVWVEKGVPAISTDDYPYLLFKVRIDDEKNSNWMVEARYTDGSLDFWIGSNTDWGVVMKKLSTNKTVESINLRVENHRATNAIGSGIQCAYFDYIMLGSGWSAAYAKIVLNDHTVFYEELHARAKNGSLYTVDITRTKYVYYGNYIKIPISVDMLKIENSISFITDAQTFWKVERALIYLHTDLRAIHEPYWRLFVPYIFLIFVAVVAILCLLCARLYKWIRSIQA